MHTGELVEAVLSNVNDPEGIRYSLGQIIQLLNQGQADFLRKTKTALRGRATLSADLTLDPAGAFYPVPSDLYAIESVELDGKPLAYSTERGALCSATELDAQTGVPRAYMYGRYGRNLRLYPYVAAAVGVVLPEPIVDYVRRAVDLGVSQRTELDDNDAIALAHYATAWILMNDDDMADPSKATVHKAEYEAIVDAVRGAVAHNHVRTPRTVRRGTY